MPPNVTRHLELKYSKTVTMVMEYVIVKAKFRDRIGRRLFIEADMRSREGMRLANSKAVHWIVDENCP
ncbi:MAG: hypothetical protein U9R58_12390 [Chloroflexota bacterium]|nr:hypothetical protein [Chloroflexota bacterium]